MNSETVFLAPSFGFIGRSSQEETARSGGQIGSGANLGPRAKWLSQTRKCGVVATSSGMIDALINAGGFDNGRGSAPITSSSLGYRKLPHETSYSCGGITAPL